MSVIFGRFLFQFQLFNIHKYVVLNLQGYKNLEGLVKTESIFT